MTNNIKEQTHEKEPLFHLIKRTNLPVWKAWLIRGIGLVAALLICGLFVYLVEGVSLADSFREMWNGTFGNPDIPASIKIKLPETAAYAAKLLCIAVALAPAFKMKFWNIGAEGQVLMGALATAVVMREWSSLPTPVLYILMFVLCILAGAIWAVIPAIFKAKWGTNETLFTLMMNYVAIAIVNSYYNYCKGAKSAMDAINRDTKIGYLPKIFDLDAGINILVFLIIAVLMFFYLKKTKHGYEISVVGESVNTARYAGINVKKVIIRTMILSGVICGLCGGLTVAGQSHSISSETAGGFGFTAIIVAWLAKFNTLGMIIISLLIIFLQFGTGQLGNKYPAFSTGAGDVMIGFVLFFIIGSEFFINYRIIFRNRGSKIAEEIKGKTEGIH